MRRPISIPTKGTHFNWRMTRWDLQWITQWKSLLASSSKVMGSIYDFSVQSTGLPISPYLTSPPSPPKFDVHFSFFHSKERAAILLRGEHVSPRVIWTEYLLRKPAPQAALCHLQPHCQCSVSISAVPFLPCAHKKVSCTLIKNSSQIITSARGIFFCLFFPFSLVVTQVVWWWHKCLVYNFP